jgi:hypothetical protein
MWLAVPILSLFQLVRNPTFIKNFLRPIRVGLGPTTFLWTVAASGLQLMSAFGLNLGSAAATIAVFAFALVSGVSSMLAILIFRPDNSEVLQGSILQSNISDENFLDEFLSSKYRLISTQK